MNTGYHPSFQSVHVQLLITIFLAILLWALYQRLRKLEFFRWWAWAWTCSAVFLAAAIESVRVGYEWTPLKVSLLLIVMVFGMLQPLLLALGGLSWRLPGQSLESRFKIGIGLLILLSALGFAAGYALSAERNVSFAARNLPRTVSMVAALGYCCFSFFGQWRRKRSWAALMSGTFCLLYAINQFSYTIDFIDLLQKHFGATHVTPNPVDYV